MKRIILLIVICLAGCQSNVIKIQPKLKPINYKARWMALAIFVKQHFETDKSVEWIATDLSLAAYNAGIE